MSKPKQWSKLDNAAKIFPPSSNGRDPRVFRFSCELLEPVDPKVLEQALEQTLDLFPFYRTVIKKGLFWYYLEDTELKPVIRQEQRHPCSPLYDGNRRSLLFSVTYYRCRINLEVYHILSDGSGAIQFFRNMMLAYIQLKHHSELEGKITRIDYNASQSERGDDSFLKYYTPGTAPGEKVRHPKAYQLRGDRLPLGEMGVIEGVFPVGDIISAAKARKATITEFLTAVLICAIGEGVELRYRHMPITISVPVDLRRFFPSVSARNFFGVMNISVRLGERIDLEDILGQVQREFAIQLTEEKMRQRMNKLAAMEHNLLAKAVPLVLKDPIMGAAVKLADRQVTASLSNVGRIGLPGELDRYVERFGVFNSTRKIQVLVCSFKDKFYISFTSIFSAPDVQRRFFRMLTDMGMSCEISSNWVENERGLEDVL